MLQALQTLKSLSMDRLDLDEMVALSVTADSMIEKYKAMGMEAPEWLKDAAEGLNKEVRAQRRANLELALKQAQRKREGLRTAEERRDQTDKEIERLRKELETV